MLVDGALGDEEGIWKAAQELRKMAGGRPGRAPEVTYEIFDEAIWDIQTLVKGVSLDAETTSGIGTFTIATGPYTAFFETFLHDPVAAKFALLTSKNDPNDQTIIPLTNLARGLIATEMGDHERAVTELEAYLGTYSNPAVVWASAGLNCWVAPAEEAAGHSDKADAVIKTGGSFVDCYRFRADILDGRGDWVGAKSLCGSRRAGAGPARGVLLLGCGALEARRPRGRRGEARKCK